MKIITDWLKKRKLRKDIQTVLRASPEEMILIEDDGRCNPRGKTLLDIFSQAQLDNARDKAKYIIYKLAKENKQNEQSR